MGEKPSPPSERAISKEIMYCDYLENCERKTWIFQIDSKRLILYTKRPNFLPYRLALSRQTSTHRGPKKYCQNQNLTSRGSKPTPRDLDWNPRDLNLTTKDSEGKKSSPICLKFSPKDLILTPWIRKSITIDSNCTPRGSSFPLTGEAYSGATQCGARPKFGS